MMSDKCDWGLLISALDENIFSTNNKKQKTNIQKTNKPSYQYKKNILHTSELSARGKSVYDYILKECPTDDHILRMKDLIHNGVVKDSKKISGRTIDILVTQLPRHTNACYYLDITDSNNIFIVESDINTLSDTNRKIILFDIGSSYKKKMQQYSKAYFDCFRRGDIVLHTLRNGTKLELSLCQYNFFLWASQFKVFDFLIKNLDKISTLKQIKSNKANIKMKIKMVYQLPKIKVKKETLQRKKVLMMQTTQKKRHIFVGVMPLSQFLSCHQ